MSIVLTCGHALSGPEVAHALLKSAGLADANLSKQQKLSPQDLTRKLLDAHGVVEGEKNTFAQIAPSRVWEALTVDLMVANLDAPHWGWPDAHSLYLLDYMRDFDPRVRFCLVYSSPAHVAANYIASQTSDADGLNCTIENWVAYNSELLRFYYRNRDRSLLVNIEPVFVDPQEFLTKARDVFGFEFSEPQFAENPAQSQNAVARLAASVLLRDAKEADALFQELESVAQVPSFATMDASTLACRAWSENHAQAKRIESLGFGKNLARTQHETQQQENERLLQKLEDGREDAAELSARLQRVELAHQSLQTEHSELKTKFRQAQDARGEGEPRISSSSASQGKASHSEVTTLQAKLAEADKRADLLLLQLQQVQDELEHYFLKYRELSGKATPSEASDATPTQLTPASVNTLADVATAPAVGKAANASPSNTNKTVSATAKTTNLTIDMRHFIDGENWYFAEDDGRWSGPGTKSVLRMPPLSKGRYSLELDIVDAMSAEIVHGLRATLDGKPLSLRFKNLGRKNGAGSGAMASVKQLYKEVWRREPVWPVRASGELEIDTPTTERRSTLELQFPNVISPASRGGLDDRALAIRLKQARICSI